MNPRGRPGRLRPGVLVGAAVVVLGLALLAWTVARQADEQLLRSLVEGEATAAHALLDRGASVHARVGDGEHRGKTALMLAVQTGDAALVERIIRAGARVDQDNDRGGTALMYAATRGDSAVVARLLEAGADPDRQASNGWTALMLATAKGHHGVIGQLAAAGADLDLADVYGWTPLMRAAEQGDAAAQSLLLELGADPGRRNDQGLDAADIATRAALPPANGRAGSQAVPDLLESDER